MIHHAGVSRAFDDRSVHAVAAHALGERERVPTEAIRLGRWLVTQELKALRLVPTLRMDGSGRWSFLTENGNFIVDCAPLQPMRDGRTARELERALLAIVGVVHTEFFLGTADRVLVGHPNGRVDAHCRAEGRSP